MDEQELANRVRVLRGVDIFSELRKPLLEELALKVELVELKAGEPLITKGEQGYDMYVITQGQVKVHDGNYEFAKLGQGECFGEYALIDPEVRNASISATSDTALFKLNQEDFYNLVEANPGFVNAVLVILIRRLRKVDEVQKSLAKSYQEITRQKEKNVQQDLALSTLSAERDKLKEILSSKLIAPLKSSLKLANELKQKVEVGDSNVTEGLNFLLNSLSEMNAALKSETEPKSTSTKPSSTGKKVVNLGVLLQSVAQKLMTPARKKNILLELECENVYALLDRVQAFQIVENLVSNAITYSLPGKRVFLKAGQRDGKSVIEVKDQGPGFTEEDKKDLYVKFKRLSAVPTAGESGLGLGLSTAKEYIDALGGEITLISEKGNGACFTVSFDAAKVD